MNGEKPERRSSAPAFSQGEVVAGRYRVGALIGQGSMGEVYEAEDLELRARVALKVLRALVGQESHAIERFKREILLAHKVTHPNVCRIFDLARHVGASGEPVLFLSMELLAGETLAARIERCGPLRLAEALPVAAQIAEALAAAHRVGVIHRDFKSGNVMLVPGPDGDRAVVTDFGLARASWGDPAEVSTLTVSGGLIGTPAYMAPEQVEGLPVTTAADVYSLGIVLYEMVTGYLPFVGDNPLATAVRRLRETPASPRAYVPDLDRQWERVILRCLEREPEKRFASPLEVVRALSGEVTLARPRRPRSTMVTIALAAAVALALVAGVWLVSRRFSGPQAPGERVAAARVTPRRAVAVLGFRNTSGRPEVEWLGAAFSEMLTTELAAGEQLRTISGESVARAKLELAIEEPESLAADTLQRLRALLGAEHVVLGSYTAPASARGGELRLDLRIQEAESGETVPLSVSGSEEALFDLVEVAGQRLREHLGVSALAADEIEALRSTRPANATAERLFAEGLKRLHAFEPLAARDLLEKAALADPEHALTQAALAAAWEALGYEKQAREAAARALSGSAKLPREERLQIEGLRHKLERDWGPAIETYEVLWGYFPDHLEHGLRLAETQVAAAEGNAALATIEELKQLPPPAGADPRIDLMEAKAADSVADLRRRLAAAQEAARKASALGARILHGRALFEQGGALRRLGEKEKAVAALSESERTLRAAGDEAGAARAQLQLGHQRRQEGDVEGALALYREAHATFMRLGNEGSVARCLFNIGLAQSERGKIEQARQIYEDALAVFRKLDDRDGMTAALSNLGTMYYYQGRIAESLAAHDESLRMSRELGNESRAATTQISRGSTLLDQGDLKAAGAALEEGLRAVRAMGDRGLEGHALAGLGELLLLEGDLPAARARFAEARGAFEQVGALEPAAICRLDLARVAVEAGELEAAIEEGRAAQEILGAAGYRDEQALAWATLARAFALQGERERALEAAARALDLAAESEQVRVRLIAGLAAGGLEAESGKPGRGRERLRQVREEAARLHLGPLEVEARLALALAARAAGEPTAVGELAQVASMAEGRGFLLLARQVRSAIAAAD